jgi:lipoyl(octanoyl) transferase
LIPVRWLNRGGGCLVHGPGQLAAYPILPLDRLGCGLADYRQRLEEAVIDLAREQHVPAYRRPGEPGVFSRLGQIAHVGAAVRAWVAYHGLYVNVDPAPDLLRLVYARPLGERTTSLTAVRGRLVSMNAVRESLIRHLVRRLGYTRFHIYTGHPLLRPQRQRVYVGA